MKSAALVLMVIICTFPAISQRAKKPNPYRFGVGAGYYPNLKEPYAVDLKFYTKSGNAFEVIGYNLEKSYRLTALFNPYFTLSRDGKLRLVVGPGVHVGVWKDEFKTNNSTTNPILGLDGILGVEYRVPKLPLSFQLHFQPSADIAGNNEYFYDSKWLGGIVRFVF
ncbi:MAG: hypothetical protein V4717_23895 [Bacteroidota bacterium]